MTAALAGPYLIVCTILGLGGVAKLVSPSPARRAIGALGIPVPIAAVRILGMAEVVLACTSVLKGGRIMPSLVGMAYLAFAAFVVAILRQGDSVSCGCFGSNSTPPSWLHVAVNLTSAAVAFGAIGIDGLATTLDDQAGAGIPLLGLVVVGSYLLYLLLTVLPVVMAPPQPAVEAFSINEDRTR
jgi:hypothetical protein